MRRVSRDLVVARAVQFFAAFLFAMCILDMGAWTLATERLSAAYWVGVIVVLVRRSNSLTPGDHVFLRFGLVPVLTAGIPITFAIWSHRGLI